MWLNRDMSGSRPTIATAARRLDSFRSLSVPFSFCPGPDARGSKVKRNNSSGDVGTENTRGSPAMVVQPKLPTLSARSSHVTSC